VPDTRAAAKSGERFARCGDQAVADVFAAANYRKAQARWNFGGNIFYAMDGKIDLLAEKSFFKFLDEHPFAADLREGSGLQFVASSLDHDDFDVHSGGFENLPAHEFGLPFGEHAPTSADTDGFHRLVSPVRQKKLADGFDLLNLAAEVFFALQAASGVEKYFFQKVVDQRFDLFALFLREAGNPFSAFHEQIRRDPLSICAEGFPRR